MTLTVTNILQLLLRSFLMTLSKSMEIDWFVLQSGPSCGSILVFSQAGYPSKLWYMCGSRCQSYHFEMPFEVKRWVHLPHLRSDCGFQFLYRSLVCEDLFFHVLDGFHLVADVSDSKYAVIVAKTHTKPPGSSLFSLSAESSSLMLCPLELKGQRRELRSWSSVASST